MASFLRKKRDDSPSSTSPASQASTDAPGTTDTRAEDKTETEGEAETPQNGAATTVPNNDGALNEESQSGQPSPTAKKDARFWLIIVTICITSLLAALESTVVSTALPTISKDLDAGALYIWFINAFFLTSAIFQPLFGQTANLFGQRWLMVGAVATFLLGSGISGGANSPAMLIAGRALQGAGGGGINVMIEIIVSDILPLRERGAYMGLIFSVFSIGTSLGPVIGGLIVTNISWRWVFYINLPIGGLALVLLVLFLKVRYPPDTWQSKLKCIDYIGNALLIASLTSVLIALSWGGAVYPWKDYHVLVPLILGFAGIGVFHVYEALPWVKEPVTPPCVFGNRTSAAALAIAFLHQLLTFWAIFFIPLYFQSVKLYTPTISGVDFLPIVIICVPTAMAAGIMMSTWGRYRWIHQVAFGFMALGQGLFSTLDQNSSTAEWAIYQILFAIGSGMLLTTSLAAVQAGLSESDVAVAAATQAFMRSYGAIFGVSVPAAIFNSRFGSLASKRISDPAVLAKFSNGAAYSSISREYRGVHESMAPRYF